MTNSDISHLHHCFLEVKQKIATDTRKDCIGALFFCLSGERFNGNLYAQKALELGAAYVVTNSSHINDERIILMEDPNNSLLELARYHSNLAPCNFIAIGGSNGKTSTKELVNAVLSTTYRTHATPGNFNNHIGVPLTLLAVNAETQMTIVEMGTNHPGEMRVLSSIFETDAAIVTNIGKEHLEGFEDLEAVAKEESELYLMAQRDSAIAFVNSDDPWLQNMSKRLPKKITYSIKDASSDIFVEILKSMPFLEVSVFYKQKKLGEIRAHLGGDYNASNIAAAVAIGLHYQVPFERIQQAIESYIPSMNRSQWITSKTGVEILLDAYNANPSSMELGIQNFSKLEGKKTLMLGDMLELGDHSQKEHKALFELAQELGYTDMYLVGNEFKQALPSFPFVFDNTSSLLAWLDTHPIEADYVFIKGSRGIAMEQCLDHFALS